MRFPNPFIHRLAERCEMMRDRGEHGPGHERRGFGRGGPGGRGPFGRGGRFFENGMLKLIVLAMLAEQPRHGYELIKEIEEKTGGTYAPSAGVIYPTLTLLEETDLVTVLNAEGNRKLYGITDAGRALVEENRPAIDAVFARFADAGKARASERDPRLVRAVENLKMALRFKAEGGNLTHEQIAELAALLDETTRRIEAL
ncbi:PadR family transcriptional regulator [Oryzibacter oryziterrae]|uniref:PadR family transcriptional regulator n=1 Tax=Oryzibacter oryziterrae TaxID=2766474 RepID=UPI001F39AC97|nr:PadR family transcriptional regulator [Oryzibacter oryziterrae]